MRDMVAFGGGGLARAAHLRTTDEPAATRILPLWHGRIPVRDGALAWLPADGGGDTLFLGLTAAGACHARDITSPDLPEDVHPHPALPPGAAFVELRQVMTQLSPEEAELAATAKALSGWHRSHGFCAACGTRTDPAAAGWQRVCPACGTHHFPRTDPVVIMLVLDGERLLLGRSPGWAPGMHSCLAGFVEPGETLEAAVRREVAEETAVRVGAVRYLASQPWPWPSSLMFGCVARAESTAITIDPAEIEAARWADRAEVMEARIGRHPDLVLPRAGTIAHHLITRWLADDLD